MDVVEGGLVDVRNILDRGARRPPIDWDETRENGARVLRELLESWI